MPTGTSGPLPKTLPCLGQGKTAMTLLTDAGCYYPVISHDSYSDRLRIQSAPQPCGRIRGARPMHRTTLIMGKPPWTADQSFLTTTKQNFGGSKKLGPARRPLLCPSMHKSQIKLARPQDGAEDWNTHYTETFMEKPLIPANRLHLTSLVNRIDQTEGKDMKESVKMDRNPTNYFSQYNRIHNKLGCMLGPGVPQDYPIRQQFNVITGEMGGPAWKEDNKRVSGNRVLHDMRRQRTSILG